MTYIHMEWWQLDEHLDHPEWTFVDDGPVNVTVGFLPEGDGYSWSCTVDEPFMHEQGNAPSFLKAVEAALGARQVLVDELKGQ